jgi:hypothetical protein
MKDFILRLPAPVRHLVLTVASVGLAWLGTDVVGPLQDQPGYGPLAAGLLLAFLAYATPLVTSYGAGAERARELGARDVSR